MIFGTISRLVTAGKQKKLANKINPVDVNYEDNAQSKERLSMARTNLRGRMAGAGAFGRNINQNTANAMGSVTRNATSGAQSIATAAAMQGKANESFGDLQTREAQDFERKQGTYSNVLAQEGGKIFGDQLRKFQQDRAAKDALMRSSMENKSAAFDGLDAGISMVAGTLLGQPGAGKAVGGFVKNLFKKKTKTTTKPLPSHSTMDNDNPSESNMG